MTCPSCGQDGAQARCECGYNPFLVTELQQEQLVWRRRRNRWLVIGLVGTVTALLVPLGLPTLPAGFAACAGVVVPIWSVLKGGLVAQRLRAARSPRQLPEARLL